MDIRSRNSRRDGDDVRNLVVGRRMSHDGKKQAPRRARKPLRSGSSSERESAWTAHRERLLDEALKETFPASDPPSIAMPSDQSGEGNG